MNVQAIDPRRYHEVIEAAVMSPVAAKDPVCLYLETTNRCNLLCTTCPRTYADLEPQAGMSWELFTRIVDQVPNIARVVLHGGQRPTLHFNHRNDRTVFWERLQQRYDFAAVLPDEGSAGLAVDLARLG